MKRVLRLIIPALVALCLCSCANSFKDIKVTSCELLSLTPKGLSSLDATVNLGIDNPTVQVTLSQMNATVKMEGEPCLHITADDVTLAPRTKDYYPIELHGTIDGSFNPFQLLTLLNNPNLEPLTIDVRFHGTLKSGLGKDFEYLDIPIKDLLDQI